MAEDLQPIFSGDESPGRPPSFLRRLCFLWIPVIIIATCLICGVFAPFLAPHDPFNIDLLQRRIAPFENANFPLGTDIVGQDILSRLIYGARSSAFICLAGLIASGLLGLVPGLIAGYRGGFVERIVLSITARSSWIKVARFFISVFVALSIITVIGPSAISLIAVVAILFCPQFARAIRDKICGAGDYEAEPTVIENLPDESGFMQPRHPALPGIATPILATIPSTAGSAVLIESFLSFLGFGLPLGHPSWGVMIAEARFVLISLISVWWLALFPALAIAITVIALKLFGRWIRENPSPTAA